MGLNTKAWDGGFKRVTGTETAKKTLAIATDDSNQIHILHYDLAGTDLGLSADTYPTVYIHGTASVSEYAKMYDDSTDFHIQVVGANLLLNTPSSKDITLQVNSIDEFVFDANALSLGTNKLQGSSLVIDAVASITFQLGSTNALIVDDGVITSRAGLGTTGKTVYIGVEAGGSGAGTAAGAGASIYINAGEGGSTTGSTGTGGAGGAIWLIGGTSGAGSSGVLGGAGGDINLLPGYYGGTAVSPGYIRMMGSPSWVAAGAGGTLSTIALSGPAGTFTLHQMLKIKNNNGTVVFIPAWIQV